MNSPRSAKVLTSLLNSELAWLPFLLVRPLSAGDFHVGTSTKFWTVAYIISVNAIIVSQTGGTCVCPPTSTDLCDSDPEYALCVNEVKRDLVTATAAVAALTTFCMGLFANMPIALGMIINFPKQSASN